MKYEDLIKKIDFTDPSENTVKVVEAALGQLMLTLGEMIPQNKAMFAHQANQMRTMMDSARRNELTVMKFFSGHGRLANKLREHINIMRHLSACSIQSNSPIYTLQQKQYFDRLEHMLMDFDHKPSEDPSVVTPLREYIASLRPVVLSTTFRHPKEALTGEENLDDLETGIYGDTSNADAFSIILRTRPEKGIAALLVYQPGQVSMFYYHPEECTWVNSDYSSAFSNTLQDLMLEFQVALAQNQPMERDFSFDEELAMIRHRWEHMVEDEQYLPNLLVLNNDREDKKRTPDCGYISNPQYSVFTAGADGVVLTFYNTKGEYASKSMTFMSGLQKSPTVVRKDEISKSTQLALIKQANLSLAKCESLIAQLKHNRKEAVMEFN